MDYKHDPDYDRKDPEPSMASGQHFAWEGRLFARREARLKRERETLRMPMLTPEQRLAQVNEQRVRVGLEPFDPTAKLSTKNIIYSKLDQRAIAALTVIRDELNNELYAGKQLLGRGGVVMVLNELWRWYREQKPLHRTELFREHIRGKWTKPKGGRPRKPTITFDTVPDAVGRDLPSDIDEGK